MPNRSISCVIDGCKGRVLARGLCRSHYYMLRSAIQQGRIKGWEEAIELGLSCRAVSGRNIEKRDLFEKMFSSKKNGQGE